MQQTLNNLNHGYDTHWPLMHKAGGVTFRPCVREWSPGLWLASHLDALTSLPSASFATTPPPAEPELRSRATHVRRACERTGMVPWDDLCRMRCAEGGWGDASHQIQRKRQTAPLGHEKVHEWPEQGGARKAEGADEQQVHHSPLLAVRHEVQTGALRPGRGATADPASSASSGPHNHALRQRRRR